MTFFRKIKDKLGINRLFLIITTIIFLLFTIVNIDRGKQVLIYFFNLFISTILPILFLIYFLIFVFNLILSNKKIQKKLSDGNSTTKYLFSVIGGILSSGPVYLRYPLLKKLKSNGLHRGHIATFIYARSIKIPLFPVMILYFGRKYTIVFTITLLVLSLTLGFVIDFSDKNLKF